MRFPWSRRAGRHGRSKPSWAVFFSDAAWEAFLQALELALAERGYESTRMGDVMVVRTGAGEAPMEVGLRPLAQRCAAAEDERWPEVISAHLTGLLQGRRELHTLERGDFAAVRERLRLRLYPEEVLGSDSAVRLVSAPVADGVIAALVLDSPHALASVPAEDVEAWGESRDSVWAIAKEQTREAPEHRETVEVARGLSFEARHGASFLVASQALFADAGAEGGGPLPYGRILAVPTCHLLLAHDIEDARVLMAVQAMGAQALLSFHKGPGSLSPHLYWEPPSSKQWVLLPTAPSRKGLTFRPPAAFVEQVMAPLGAEPASPGDGH